MVLVGEIEGALCGGCITGVPRHHCELKEFLYIYTQALPVLFDSYSTLKQKKLQPYIIYHVNPVTNFQLTATAIETRKVCIQKQLPINRRNFNFMEIEFWRPGFKSQSFQKINKSMFVHRLYQFCCFCHAAYDYYGLYLGECVHTVKGSKTNAAVDMVSIAIDYNQSTVWPKYTAFNIPTKVI